MYQEPDQCKIKPTTLVGFFLFASDPCGKLASGGRDPSGELASGGSDPSGELASGGLCFELDFALQPRNSEYHLPRFILLSQSPRLNTKILFSNRSRGTSYRLHRHQWTCLWMWEFTCSDQGRLN